MTTSAFAGSVPKTYHDFLGPLIFSEYARDVAKRITPYLASKPRARILELACGTGIVTAEIAKVLPREATLIATDLSEGMLGQCRTFVPADPRITFQAADACTLSFKDQSFDLLIAQYGVMFFPDKVQAMKEARRVLSPGGSYIFSIWDSLEHNPIPGTVHASLIAQLKDPPMFLAKMPYGHSDRAEIERYTRAGGFTNVKIETVGFPCIAPQAEDAARGFIEGTPVLAGLAERGIADPTPIRQKAAQDLAAKFGDKPCRSVMQAIVVTAS